MGRSIRNVFLPSLSPGDFRDENLLQTVAIVRRESEHGQGRNFMLKILRESHMKRISNLVFIFFVLIGSCYTPPPVKVIRNSQSVTPRTLFIALDGVDFDLMQELYKEGHFKNFLPPVPFISTFPSDTTLGFTGILQPLNVGKVPGYEVRFYSYKDNKIVGGTPFDIYKIPIKYKYYFDSFRHQMHEKAIMYAFPGLAGKVDLVNTEKVLFGTDKRILMTYLGGTDGFSHILGRNRTKHFLIFMDEFLQTMQKRYQKERNEALRIVLFSDHGFYHQRPKTVSVRDLEQHLSAQGFKLTSHIQSKNDIVTVPFGLLSAGVLFTPNFERAQKAEAIRQADGVDLVFWHNDSRKQIFVLNSKGESANFEYRDDKTYRYVTTKGDPLHYLPILQKSGFASGQWIAEDTWKKLTFSAEYPDAGYRLVDAFFNLVKNPASLMFSVKKGYQFGSLAARVATWAKFGHKGTHGGLFRETTWGIAMTNQTSGQKLPDVLRYNELFDYFLPGVTKAYPHKARKSEVTVILTPEQLKDAKSTEVSE
jgi:hypothetical protein